MILACFAVAENVRFSVLRYTAILKAYDGTRAVRDCRILVAATMARWIMELEFVTCSCRTWSLVLHKLSSAAVDTELSLTFQDKARVGAYVCELLDIERDLTAPTSHRNVNVDYAYVFDGLMVHG